MAYTHEQIRTIYTERITHNAAMRRGSEFSSWPDSLKEAFFSAALTLENSGKLGVLEVEHLDEFVEHGGRSARIGHADAEAIAGNRVALSIFVDRHNLVPWDLYDLPIIATKALLRPEELVEQVYPSGRYHIHGGTDHSAFQIHEWAMKNIRAKTHTQSVHKLLGWIRENMHHLRSDECDYLDYNPPKITKIIRSKIGTCHYTGALIAASLGTLNIPVLRRHYQSRHHEYTMFPTLKKVMGHNDWPYNQNFSEGPVSRMLMDWTRFFSRVRAVDTPGEWEQVSDALNDFIEASAGR